MAIHEILRLVFQLLKNVKILQALFILEKKYHKKQSSGLIFCGYLKGNLRKKGAKDNTEHLSRVHKQPNRIYHINGVNPTLSSSEKSGRYYIYDEIGVRKLTIDECYKIMGFPDKYYKSNKISDCYSQIGNSVSPIIISNIKDELIKQNFIQNQQILFLNFSFVL